MVRRIQAYKTYYSDFMQSLSDAERLKVQRAKNEYYGSKEE